MIGISKLYCGAVEPADVLRYNRESGKLPSELLQFSRDKKPVVVWNCTQTCNLRCVHCYAGSECKSYEGEMSSGEAKAMIDDLSAFGAPVLLFSGGEPCMREDVVELMQHAKDRGMRVVLSTNGTLITPELAALRRRGAFVRGRVARWRARRTTSSAACPAVSTAPSRACATRRRRASRWPAHTVNKRNWREIGDVFDIMEAEGVKRACFYHLVYTGRGSALMDEDLDHAETRAAVRLIMDRTRDWFDRGGSPEILTVDNHADGPFVYLELLRENPARAEEVLQLLQWNRGNSTGAGIGCVSWDGEVYADQFWRHFPLGNVRERTFSEIWGDTSRATEQSELMFRLKDKRPFVKGRCQQCRWLDICNGNFRVRSEAATGDLWGPDPACYLTDEEIGVA
ncbi:MAG: radical SAM protein [Gordonibacter urolithinfaciens]